MLWSKSKDGRDDGQEFVGYNPPEINKLLKVLHSAVNHLVVNSTRMSAAFNISAADPVLFIVIGSSLFVNNRGPQTLVTISVVSCYPIVGIIKCLVVNTP